MEKIHASERNCERTENNVRDGKIEDEDVPGIGLDIVDDGQDHDEAVTKKTNHGKGEVEN